MEKYINKNSPLISVILNCYNSDQFLNKSINSVIKQSYKNWELIIFDNFSKDKTKSEVLKFKKYKKIKYFKTKKFYSLYQARNLAIKKTRGEFVCFIDADDWWLKDKLSAQIRYIQFQKNINVIYSNLFLFYENNKKRKLFSYKKLYNGFITQSLLNDFKMPILTTMIKRKILLKYKFDRRFNIIGDFDLFLRISLKEKVLSIQKPLAYYRIHSSNLSKKRIDLNIKELETWVRENIKKKQFKKYDFSNLNLLIKTLKIKNFFENKNIYKAMKELFKKPIKLKNFQHLAFLFLQKRFLDKIQKK